MTNDSQPPKLLFATVSLRKGSGGIAELSRQVFRALLEMHHNQQIELAVHVLEEAEPPAGDELLAGDNLRFFHWFGGHRWKFALSLVTARSDVQLMDHVGLARLPGLMPKVLRKNYILLIHGIEIWDSHRADYRRSAMKASLLIANSEYTAGKVRTRYPGLPKIKVCHPGIDIPAGCLHAGDDNPNDAHNPAVGASLAREKTPGRAQSTLLQGETPNRAQSTSVGASLAREDAPNRAQSTLLHGPHAILIVGRLSAEQNHKGHDHLLEAMPQILQSVPDAQLVIAGEGDDQPRLQGKVEKLGLKDHVIFTGWVSEDQLHSLYAQCAVFAMLSTGDGFGLVFLEAMAHGTPCVGLKTGSAAEIIEDGETGLLVDRDDSREVARKISSLLQDAALLERLGANARKRYEADFQAMHHTKRLQSILLPLMAHST